MKAREASILSVCHGIVTVVFACVVHLSFMVGCCIANEVTLTPTADTFVDEYNPDTPQGAHSIMTVSASWSTSGDDDMARIAFLRFDYSSIPQGSTIDYAEFRLTRQETGWPVNPGVLLGVGGLSKPNWSESTMTWNNGPFIGSTPEPLLGVEYVGVLRLGKATSWVWKGTDFIFLSYVIDKVVNDYANFSTWKTWFLLGGDWGCGQIFFTREYSVSNQRPQLYIRFTPPQETISPPTSITGPSPVVVNRNYEYCASGASSSLGHTVQYRFDKGDGSSPTIWESDGCLYLGWSDPGNYGLKAQARCATHTDKVSAWSGVLKTVRVIPVPITVISPNGGESWQQGSTYDITWSYTADAGAYVKIELYKRGSFHSTITSSTPNTGSSSFESYPWRVPTDLEIADDYMVKITSTSNSDFYDYSDAWFSIAEEHVKPTVSIVASDADAGEPANNGYFTVSRTGSTTGSLRVYYGTSGSTAIAGSDYAALPGYVDIPLGQASALISVVVINDSSVEGPETVKVTISSNTAYDIDPSKSYATVTIVDDPRIFSFLSGIVFDDLDHDSDIDSGEEVAGAVVSCQGRSATTGTMTERDGEYIISGLTPTSGDGLVDVEVRINDTLYGGLCITLEEGSNVCDIPIYKPEIDSANECGNAWTSCGIGFLGLIPFVGTYWDIESTRIAMCTANYRFNEGDPIGGIIAEIKAAMSAWHAIVNILDYLDGGTGQAADALPVTLKCLESLFWEYLNDQCKGYTSCLWDTLRDGALTPLLPLLAVFTGSPVDIRISDLQGNILQLAGDGFPLNNLPSIGWISRSPNDKELALVFSAEGTYIVEIIGRPEAGTGSTFNLQIMRQSADGTQGLFIYSDVPIAAGGIATAIAGEELEPVLQVDVDGDGTIDNYISPMVPVDDLVKIYVDESGYDHGTNQLSVDVTVINASRTYIGVPLQIVIQSISEPNVTMSDVNSTSQDAKNYVDLSELLLDDRQLEPSESITKRIYFYDPNGLRFTFEPSVRGVILEQPSSGPLEQLSGLSSHWLEGEPSLDMAPVGGDGIVNFRDFALMAEDWLNKEG